MHDCLREGAIDVNLFHFQRVTSTTGRCSISRIDRVWSQNSKKILQDRDRCEDKVKGWKWCPEGTIISDDMRASDPETLLPTWHRGFGSPCQLGIGFRKPCANWALGFEREISRKNLAGNLETGGVLRQALIKQFRPMAGGRGAVPSGPSLPDRGRDLVRLAGA